MCLCHALDRVHLVFPCSHIGFHFQLSLSHMGFNFVSLSSATLVSVLLVDFLFNVFNAELTGLKWFFPPALSSWAGCKHHVLQAWHYMLVAFLILFGNNVL